MNMLLIRSPSRWLLRAACAILATLGFAVLPASGADDGFEPGVLPLKRVADVPLGGRPTRLDYASLDRARHLLFVAHLGDGQVIVFATLASSVVKRVPLIASVHGVLAIPELSRVYASATGSNEVVAIDETTLNVTARIPGGVYPDGMAFAPDVHKLYVSDETGGTETVIDVRSNMRIATIPLGGEVGNTQYDPVTRHIFVNVQSRQQLVEIDPATDRIVARVDLPGAQGNHGLLIEPGQRLAFIACEGNDRLLVFDMRTSHVTSTFDVGPNPDVLAFDSQRHLLYVAGEAGIVSLFKAESGSVEKIGDGHVGSNAHVVAVDEATHRAYFPLRNVQGQTMLRITAPQG